MKQIKVLGPGCSRCETLKANTDAAVKQLGIDAEVEKITDINEITGFGVMMTPALVIDGEVKTVGKVPSADEIKQMLS